MSYVDQPYIVFFRESGPSGPESLINKVTRVCKGLGQGVPLRMSFTGNNSQYYIC